MSMLGAEAENRVPLPVLEAPDLAADLVERLPYEVRRATAPERKVDLS